MWSFEDSMHECEDKKKYKVQGHLLEAASNSYEEISAQILSLHLLWSMCSSFNLNHDTSNLTWFLLFINQ